MATIFRSKEATGDRQFARVAIWQPFLGQKKQLAIAKSPSGSHFGSHFGSKNWEPLWEPLWEQLFGSLFDSHFRRLFWSHLGSHFGSHFGSHIAVWRSPNRQSGYLVTIFRSKVAIGIRQYAKCDLATIFRSKGTSGDRQIAKVVIWRPFLG